jgi:hypothetical protein
MKARAASIVLALGVVVALALPGAALAGGKSYKVPASTYEVVQAHASNGFELAVSVFDRRAEIRVEKQIGRGGSESTSYAMRRRLPKGPDLDFRLGQEIDVDLHFVPEKVTEHRHPNCTGGGETDERGHFVGKLSFRGRDGFSRFEGHRMAGAVTRVTAGTCRAEKNPDGLVTVGVGVGTKSSRPAVQKGALELIAGTSDRRLSFTGYRFEAPDAPEGLSPNIDAFDAFVDHREPGYTVSSIAFASLGEGESFVSPDPSKPLSAAEVSPSAPFSGSAKFEMTSPGHGEWSGDLAVELPGYGLVPLTGPKIAAGLCVTKACTPTLPKSIRPRTGGSGLEEGRDEEGFDGSFYAE